MCYKYYYENIYYEIWDQFVKVIYAIFAALDMIWGCVAVEAVSIIVMFVVRPFRFKNHYILCTGENILVIASNLIAEFYEGKMSINEAIVYIILCIVPVIASYYIYLIFDFIPKGEDDYGDECNDELPFEMINILLYFVLFFTGLFYGSFIVYQISYNSPSFKDTFNIWFSVQ